MSREQSDEETEDGQVDDGTAETEVNWSDPGPELVPKDIPIVPGATPRQTETVHV